MHLLSQHSCNSIFTLGCSITLVWELILQLWISSRYTQLSTYKLFVDFLHNVMHNTSTTIINSASSISMSSTMIKINVVHSNTPFYVSPTSLKCRSQLYHTTTHYYKPSDNQYYGAITTIFTPTSFDTVVRTVTNIMVSYFFLQLVWQVWYLALHNQQPGIGLKLIVSPVFNNIVG
jgi:hypothetical protein